MVETINLKYIENEVFKGRTKEETEEYNNYQLKGFELYKSCNFNKELKRNINKYIEEYTKFFIHSNNKYIMTVSPMKKSYPGAYYEHCKSYRILVDYNNKCLLLTNSIEG